MNALDALIIGLAGFVAAQKLQRESEVQNPRNPLSRGVVRSKS